MESVSSVRAIRGVGGHERRGTGAYFEISSMDSTSSPLSIFGLYRK